MRLSEKEIDDIRVASLLQDMENIEITARVVRKAMDDLGEEDTHKAQHTFHGTDLVQSLGTVLTGAFPLVLNTNVPEFSESEKSTRMAEVPLGGRIIQSVRAYDTLMNSGSRETGISSQDAINELRRDTEADHHPAVLHALECVINGNAGAEPAYKSNAKDSGTSLNLSV
jgi:response regulator RpfG family c-di-GMP phosphodiesterase